MMGLIGVINGDSLIVDMSKIVTEAVRVASGQNLKRGAVLGKVKYACPTSGTAGTNTGNGTVTLVKPGRRLRIGTYTVTCLYAATNGGTFRVTNPDGNVLGTFAITAGAGQVADFYSDEIAFRVTDGSTDFAANDSFTIAVTGYIPSSASLSGTGNGTMVQVEARRMTRRGAYTATCVLAATNGGDFSVKDSNSLVIGTAKTSKFVGTGNGTLTEVKAGPLFKKNGPYVITCTAAATNGGTFSVVDPDGDTIGTFSITAGAGASYTFWHDQISFKITDGSTDFAQNDAFTLYWFETDQLAFVIWDGSTDFALNDVFTVTCAISDEEVKLVNADNVDGSQAPYAVLAHDVDASLAVQSAVAYVAGVFDERSLYFGGNDTVETHRHAMSEIGIHAMASSRV